MKIAVFYNHVKDAAKQQNVSVDEMLAYVSSLGYEYIEMEYKEEGAGPELYEKFQKYGLKVSSVWGNYHWQDGQDDMDGFRHLKVAKEMHSELVMPIPGFFTGDPEKKEEELENMYRGMRILVEEAKKMGLTAVIEDYDNGLSPIGTAAGMHGFCERIPDLRVAFDTGNFAFNADDTKAAYELLKGDGIVHMHLKDRSLVPTGGIPKTAVDGTVLYPCSVGKGIMPIQEIVADLEKKEYNGIYAAEFFEAADYKQAIKESMDFLKNITKGDKEMKSKVYFSKEITPEKVVELFKLLEKDLPGKVAVKVHSGEAGNQNFIGPEFWKPMVDYVNGTICECNTAYPGVRDTTKAHIKLLADHGWSKYYNVDLLDAEGPDMELDIPDGKQIKKNYVGKDMANYDSLLVLSHFKGHPMGGFGGALKQLSIGCASSYGKKNIHGAGDPAVHFDAEHDLFLTSMADAASSVVKYFGGNAAYINVLKNLSVDCDCCAVAEDPCMADIGIMASLDPVAIDEACVEMVYVSKDPGRDHFVERVETRNGRLTIECADKLGFGTKEYELIEI